MVVHRKSKEIPYKYNFQLFNQKVSVLIDLVDNINSQIRESRCTSEVETVR